jgi:serine/threonine protein kinase
MDVDNGRTGGSAEDLAAEYVAARAGGEPAELAQFLARLATGAEREEFQALVRQAERAERSLPRALSSGTKIRGRYRIAAEIGSGGMGRVFAAFDEELQRKVAVKVLSALNAGQVDREEMFLKESRLLAALQHPNIVAVHEAGRDGDLTFIVMDLVDGTSLADVIARARAELEPRASNGVISPREGALLERAIAKKQPDGRPNLIVPRDWYATVARVMLELVRTLEAAHSQGVLHRDIKPGNVMLLGGASPVVLDFGLAGSIDTKAGTVTQGLYGSVAYLAPEQARSQQVGMDPRTDVYQLGLILYELLTLQRAFPGNAIGEVLEKIRLGEIRSPRTLNAAVPRDLDAICMMALELAPERRYATARELREDLDRYVEGREVPLAMRSSKLRAMARKMRYTVRKHPIAASIVGAIVVGGLGMLAMPQRDPGELTPFYRIDTRDRVTRLSTKNLKVYPGDHLAKDVTSVGKSYVYTLSVFGSEPGARFVFPYRTDLRDAGPWGLEVGGSDEGGPKLVVCAKIENTDNRFEGLLVLQTADKVDAFETWMDQLLANAGTTGVPYEKAIRSLEQQFTPVRGVKQGPWNDEQLESVRRVLADEATKHAKKKLDLPGVESFTIECEVAGS